MKCPPRLALGSKALASVFLGVADHPDPKPAPRLRSS
jgi:hypothetical protein